MRTVTPLSRLQHTQIDNCLLKKTSHFLWGESLAATVEGNVGAVLARQSSVRLT